MTDALQKEFLEETGTLHLLNYCASIRRRYAPRNPHKLLLGLLKRDGGIVLGKAELFDFVRRSTRVHPVFLFRTLALSIPQDADCNDPMWDEIAQLAALLFCRICSVATLRSFVVEQRDGNLPAPPLSALILQLAMSRMLVTGMSSECRVHIVFPLTTGSNCYHRLTREGMVAEHVRQLRWLFAGTAVSWQILYSDADPSGHLAAAAERVINTAILAGDSPLASLIEVVHVGVSAAPTQPTCPRIRGFKGCIAQIREGQSPGHVVLVGGGSVSVHLGLVGTLVAELQAGREVVLCDPCHPHSTPLQAESKYEEVLGFLWKQVLLRELLHHAVPRESPLCGVSARSLPAATVLTGEPCTFFFELVVRIVKACTKKPAKVYSSHPIFLEAKPPAGVSTMHNYYSYLQAVLDMAEIVLSEQRAVDPDIIAWVDFLRGIDSVARWGRLVASPLTALLHDAQYLEHDLRLDDFKGDVHSWVEQPKETGPSESGQS